MSQEPRPDDSAAPIERTVQIAGNSTFVVSLPKAWALEQGLDSGASMYLYPYADRLVAAPETVANRDRAVTIDAETIPAETVLQRARAAYVAGCEEITITGVGDRAAEPALRRTLDRTVTQLIGVTIQEDTGDSVRITDILDVSEVSLPQTITQARHLALEMYDEALEAVVTDDDVLARQVIERDDDVDRLFAFVSRGFHRGLEDIHEINRLDTDRTAAFRDYRIARGLERIADHAEGIATVATRQSGPPGEAFADRLERVGADARSVVELAFAGETERARETGAAVRETIDELDQRLYERTEPNAYLYGTVVQRIRRAADNGINIADAMTETTIDEF